ncbi:hypothetical protein Aspvir_001984 [Aspergillus viridinutans]|uniref:Major facilitator superfamily (MFS) profile domain-containing protein n=1 Tax=Aspergillus viridinutans TaxID=75553 RepID=A0A9P3C731_ASPVI|nr:uncharacterized protein Aspvir_001984 [Aspergillus viridinutans]GIK06336.1 hypothetical protein Aspvir_001984 [Aspergillus viridinutans]
MSGDKAPKASIEPPASLNQGQGQPYRILSKKQKWNIVIFVSLAGSLSPLSSNIYFPAIETISTDLGVNASLVALTITIYMVVQGIAPSIFSTLSDTCGRRLTFTICLTIYTAANLALAFTSSYPMLMVLRGLQAAGSAATISISTGVIADITSAKERGGFMGANAGMRMTGQAFGPVIGGALNSVWGFRSIFWLLFALSVVILSALLIFLPETHRGITGNGSIPLSGFGKPFIYMIKPPMASPMASKGSPESSRPPSPRLPIPMKKKRASSPLAYIFEKDIAALLAWGAVAYTAWSMVTSSTTTMLLYGFPYLNEWQLGLCFLPNGFGCICGSLSSGWLLDQSFRRAQERYRREHNIPSEERIVGRRDFPLVRARLRYMPLFSIALVISLVLYGPSFEFNDLRRHFGPNLAAPLILQFLIAFSAMALFNINSTLLIDCFPERPASATALNNLCRCLLGAAGVSVIQPLIDAVRVMKAFFIVTGVVLLFQPLILVEWKMGERWRREREDKLAACDEVNSSF